MIPSATVVTSRYRSLTPEKAKEKRMLVQWPAYISHLLLVRTAINRIHHDVNAVSLYDS